MLAHTGAIGKESLAALFAEVRQDLTETLTILNHYETLPTLLRANRHFK